jgi:hypothetical protein
MNSWLLLVLSLPTENATVRMRAWRGLKASGAAVLRDGVYLMPDLAACRDVLSAIAADVQEGAGTALILPTQDPSGTTFATLFDRTQDYAALLAQVNALREALSANAVHEQLKQLRKLRKAYAGVVEIDYFPGEAGRQCEAALQEAELAAARTQSPDEPLATNASIERLAIADYRGRVWATRRRPWVDRLACAWLIRRFIDPGAKILWLDKPERCPADALGFDFDGASFSHVGAKVTFEVLVASFALEHPALARLGGLVHFLDVGGVQPPEATGVESALAGMHTAITDDDALLASVSAVFDGLLTTFQKDQHV